MKRTRSRIAVVAPLALFAMLLAGCSSGGSSGGAGDISSDASGTACTASGSVTDSVSVSGELGELVELSVDTPAKTTEIQRAVVIDGDGEGFAADADVTVTFTVFNGKTGELINHVPNQQLQNNEQQLVSDQWAYEAVRCGSLGQRAVIAVPAWDAVGGDPAQVNIPDMAEDDSFIFVVDFVKPYVELGECDTVTPRDETFPKVDLGDGSSEPIIEIPSCMEAPDSLEITVLVEGDGPVVEENQKIMTNYVGVKWDGAERFDGNWTATGIEFDTTQGRLIDGFTQAMVGQKIGSTILVTMPAELGYGVGTGHALADTTLTFVLQLVSVA